MEHVGEVAEGASGLFRKKRTSFSAFPEQSLMKLGQ